VTQPRWKPAAPPVAVIAAAALLAACLGCGTRSDPGRTRIVRRLLPPGGEKLSTSAVFYREVEVFRWGFQTPEEIAPWRMENIGQGWEARPDGLYLRAPGPDPSLVRDVSIDARRVRAIRVEHSGLTSGAYVQLYWAHAGEAFSEERTLAADRPDATGSLTPTFTFPVGQHKQWTGTITQLRFDPTSQANRRLTMISVVGLGQVADDAALASVLRRSWRVDQQGDLRSAVLTPPGHPYEVELEVPPRATLRFSMGLAPDIAVPVRFRLSAISGNSPVTPLWIGTLRPRGPIAGCAWLDRSIDLGEYAGETITLRFETETDNPLDLFAGMPAWAGLEMVVPASTRRPPNVLLIVLDTLRADRLSLYGYDRQTSPRIDAWARERGVVFANTVAQAPWTLPSHLSLFTGLDTITHSANTGDPAAPALVTLAETLRDRGFATLAVTGGGYLAAEYEIMQGFDRVDYFYEPRLHPREAGNDLDHGMETALAWLDSAADRPFFLLLHTYEIHAPYPAREPYFTHLRGQPYVGAPPLVTTSPIEPALKEGFLFRSEIVEQIPGEPTTYVAIKPERLPLVQDLYDSSVARADAEVGRLLDRLTELGLDRETVVVLLSDHGEMLGEEGWGGHFGLHECELMVPLVVALPGGDHAGTTVSDQVRLIDVAPTLLDLLGIEPQATMDGTSLMPLVEGGAEGFPEEAWSYASSTDFGLSLRVANQQKYTLSNSPWPPANGAGELFRLAPDQRGEPAPVQDDPLAKLMRKRIKDRYQAGASGLRLRFVNHESAPLAGIVKGSLVNPLRIKAFDFPADSLRWSYQRLELTVPPGEAVTVFIEGNLHGTLLVVAELDAAGAPRHKKRQELDLESLAEPWQVVLGPDGWREDAAVELDEVTGVRVWAAGDRALVTQAGADVGDDVRAQLEALGYVVP